MSLKQRKKIYLYIYIYIEAILIFFYHTNKLHLNNHLLVVRNFQLLAYELVLLLHMVLIEYQPKSNY